MPSPNPLSRRLEVSPDLVCREVAGETLLVPIRTKAGAIDHVFSLNEVGTFVWNLFDGSRDLGTIAGEIVKEFDVGPDQAEADLIRLVDQLLDVEAVREA